MSWNTQNVDKKHEYDLPFYNLCKRAKSNQYTAPIYRTLFTRGNLKKIPRPQYHFLEHDFWSEISLETELIKIMHLFEQHFCYYFL